MVTILQMRCTEALGRAGGTTAQEPAGWCGGSREKGTKHGSRLGQVPPCLCARPATGSGLSPSGQIKAVQVLFVSGGLSQEGGVRVGFLSTSLEVAPNATPLVINNSQEKKEQSRGDRNER